jgi:hypothetical protein
MIYIGINADIAGMLFTFMSQSSESAFKSNKNLGRERPIFCAKLPIDKSQKVWYNRRLGISRAKPNF